MMHIENIAPDIMRQRLMIEGYWTIDMNEQVVKEYLLGLAAHLNLRTYSEPIIFAPSSGMGSEENAGYDAFVPLIDSGISAYFWSKAKFFSVVIYTCKAFDAEDAHEFTRSFLGTKSKTVTFNF